MYNRITTTSSPATFDVVGVSNTGTVVISTGLPAYWDNLDREYRRVARTPPKPWIERSIYTIFPEGAEAGKRFRKELKMRGRVIALGHSILIREAQGTPDAASGSNGEVIS